MNWMKTQTKKGPFQKQWDNTALDSHAARSLQENISSLLLLF